MQNIATHGVLANPAAVAHCLDALAHAGFGMDNIALLANDNINQSTSNGRDSAGIPAIAAPSLRRFLLLAGVPDAEIGRYARRIQRGYTLITVYCHNGQEMRAAQDVLAANQAADVTSTAEPRIAFVNL